MSEQVLTITDEQKRQSITLIGIFAENMDGALFN